MQRGVPGNRLILGNAQQYSDINVLDISRWGQNRIDSFPYVCGDVLYDVPPTHGGKLFSLHLSYLFASPVSIPAYRSFWHHICPIMPNLYSYRYQMRERNIEKFYLLIQKHLIIQLTKLKIFELKHHFLTLQNSPITFEQGCTLLRCLTIRRL